MPQTLLVEYTRHHSRDAVQEYSLVHKLEQLPTCNHTQKLLQQMCVKLQLAVQTCFRCQLLLHFLQVRVSSLGKFLQGFHL